MMPLGEGNAAARTNYDSHFLVSGVASGVDLAIIAHIDSRALSKRSCGPHGVDWEHPTVDQGCLKLIIPSIEQSEQEQQNNCRHSKRSNSRPNLVLPRHLVEF